MSTVAAIVAPSVDAPLEPGTVTRREVGPKDVLIEIVWAGICHSDIHTVRGDWGPQRYPLTVGHEIAGVVTEVGGEVTRHAVGDRVGVGCIVYSCRECENCLAGEEQYCLRGMTGTYGAVDRDGTVTQGGYSTHIVVDEDYVLRLPETIPFEKAAPLLCAGITTYSPLRHWNAGPGTRVAIIGLGGLGHMAVKIAHALGAEVTVLSRTLDKRDDGLALGADHYYATGDRATFTELAGSFDLILNTISAKLDMNAYLRLLSRNGALVTVGASAEPIRISEFTLQAGRRSLAASGIGGIAETQEMLDFCAEHGIVSDIELIPIDYINTAYERMLRSDVKYRFVIDIAASLK